MTNAITTFVSELTSEQQTSLLSGMQRIQQRKTAEDALLAADLLEVQLRILKLHDDAKEIRQIMDRIRSIHQ